MCSAACRHVNVTCIAEHKERAQQDEEDGFMMQHFSFRKELKGAIIIYHFYRILPLSTSFLFSKM